jgi:Skp family chaperone for outer membrane proteins
LTNARRALALPIAFTIAAAIVLVGHDAFGTRPASVPATKVATVNMTMVFERINSNTPWEVELNTLTDRLNSEATRRTELISEELKKAEALIETDPKGAQSIRDKVALMKLELDEWGSLKKLELDRERALMWRTMYQSVRDQTLSLAKADGWDIVLVNDSLGKIKLSEDMQVSREQQVISQILNRRMLYASEATDITEQLIVRVNNTTP